MVHCRLHSRLAWNCCLNLNSSSYRFAQVVRKDEDKARVNSMLLSPLIQIGDAGETFEESEVSSSKPWYIEKWFLYIKFHNSHSHLASLSVVAVPNYLQSYTYVTQNTAGRPEISEVSGASASNATKDDSDHSKHVDLWWPITTLLLKFKASVFLTSKLQVEF